MAAWARGVLPRLSALGMDLDAVLPDAGEARLSSDPPRAQRVLFHRDAHATMRVPRADPERGAQRAHALLALTIDSVHVAVSMELCPEAEADVRNALARLGDPPLLLELTSLLESMPDEFRIGLVGVPSFPRAKDAAGGDVRAALENSRRSGRALWIGWSVEREVALAHADELDELLADALVALAGVYKLLAWAPDNDLIEARPGEWRSRRARAEARREREREPRRARRSEAAKGAVRKEGSRREREDARRSPSAESREGGARVAPREPRGAERVEGPTSEPLAPQSAHARRPILRTSLRARGRAGEGIDPSLPIAKGMRVRVLAGPFMDRVGIVQEIDPKDRARVRLGLLVATIDTKELAATTEVTRPRLASSHHRPRTRGT